MNLKTTIFFITIFITVFSCQRKISDLEFEKNVMTEILPNLIDSTCVDNRILQLFPPLGKPIYDKDDNYIGSDTTDIKAERENWEKEIAKIKNDTSKIVLGFNPIIETIEEDNRNKLKQHFGENVIDDSSQIMTENYRINFEKIILNQNFKLIDRSKFPNRDAIWKTKYNFIFSGVFSVSRIQFDKEKKYGVLSAGFVCGPHCGEGFRIFIKKVNDKWIIDKVEGTWVS